VFRTDFKKKLQSEGAISATSEKRRSQVTGGWNLPAENRGESAPTRSLTESTRRQIDERFE
jgi:hypothetical protein